MQKIVVASIEAQDNISKGIIDGKCEGRADLRGVFQLECINCALGFLNQAFFCGVPIRNLHDSYSQQRKNRHFRHSIYRRIGLFETAAGVWMVDAKRSWRLEMKKAGSLGTAGLRVWDRRIFEA